MLKRIKDSEDEFPIIVENKENEIFLLIKDHNGFIRVVNIEQGGHIYSAEYTSLEEVYKECKDFKEINAELIIKE